MPSFLVRSYQLSLAQVSTRYGAITLVGGVAGLWLGAWFADRFGAVRRAAFVVVPAAALLLSIPFYAFGVLVRPAGWGLAVFVIPVALGLAWLGPVTAAIQQLVQPRMRTVASAIFLFILNLFGLGLGAVLIGALSDRYTARYGADGLGYAILAVTSFYGLGAGLLLLSAPRLSRDWES